MNDCKSNILARLLSETGFSSDPNSLLKQSLTTDNLIKSFYRCTAHNKWKRIVQKYEINLYANIRALERRILSGEYKLSYLTAFTLLERGKERNIKAPDLEANIVQRFLCDFVILPRIEKYLIYNNGASLKGKGLSFTRKNFENDLRSIQHHNGGTFKGVYMLKVDFAKFFDNIPHKGVIDSLTKLFPNEPLLISIIVNMLDAFKIDIKHLSQEERDYLKDHPYNSNIDANLTHSNKEKPIRIRLNRNASQVDDYDDYLHRSLAIGAHLSQILAIFYPTPIDILCTTVRGCRYYGRYMDDIYILHTDKAFLESLLVDIKAKARELGLFINEEKSKIEYIEYRVTFLKVDYVFKGNTILKFPDSSMFTRQRKSILQNIDHIKNNKKTLNTMIVEYKAWRQDILKHYNSAAKVLDMDNFLNAKLREYSVIKPNQRVTFIMFRKYKPKK